MTAFDALYHLRQFGGTRRFHTQRFLAEQTVFHHSASVCMILIQVLGKDCSANLLRAALQHDLEEGITGDVPAPVKWRTGNFLSDIEKEIRGHFGIATELTEEEAKLLKAADFLDILYTCLEQRLMGNWFISAIFVRLVEFNNKSQTTQCHAGMHDLFLDIESTWNHLPPFFNPLLSRSVQRGFWAR